MIMIMLFSWKVPGSYFYEEGTGIGQEKSHCEEKCLDEQVK